METVSAIPTKAEPADIPRPEDVQTRRTFTTEDDMRGRFANAKGERFGKSSPSNLSALTSSSSNSETEEPGGSIAYNARARIGRTKSRNKQGEDSPCASRSQSPHPIAGSPPQKSESSTPDMTSAEMRSPSIADKFLGVSSGRRLSRSQGKRLNLNGVQDLLAPLDPEPQKSDSIDEESVDKNRSDSDHEHEISPRLNFRTKNSPQCGSDDERWSSAFKQGWLFKKKPKITGDRWRKAFFMIGDGRLFEFEEPGQARPRRTIILQNSCAFINTDKIECFTVERFGKDSVVFKAESPGASQQWVIALKLQCGILSDISNPTIALDTTPSVAADLNGRITQFNFAAEKLFGYQKDDVIGHKVQVLMPESYATKHSQYIAVYLKTRRRKIIEQPKELPILLRDGREINVSIELCEYFDKGKFGFLARFHNPTDQFQIPSHSQSSPAPSTQYGRKKSCDETEAKREMATNNNKEIDQVPLLLYQIETLKAHISVAGETITNQEQEIRRLHLENERLSKELEEKNKELALTMKALESMDTAPPPSPSGNSSGGSYGSWGSLKDSQSKNALPGSPMPKPYLKHIPPPTENNNNKQSVKTCVVKLDQPIIVERISDGNGQRANVYECVVDGWTCAMKEIDIKHSNDKRIKMFEQEIEVLTRLQTHKNLCRYLFHDRLPNKLRLYMTKYSGTLHWKITQMQRCGEIFEATVAAKIVLDIVRGLKCLHRHNLLHRDLKSDNIFCMLDEKNEVKSVAIGDFDTARFLFQDDRAKTCIGTPGYTAPEVLLASVGELYGLKADIWGLGMVIYEIISLNRPYHDIDSTAGITQAILTGKRPTLPKVPESYQTLVDIFLQCTEINQADRPELEQIRFQLLDAYW